MLEEVRIDAVRRVEAGESAEDVIAGLGFSPQRPLYRARQQNPELVETWREKEYPKIARRCPSEKMR